MITFVMWTSVNLVTFVCICIVVQISMFASLVFKEQKRGTKR